MNGPKLSQIFLSVTILTTLFCSITLANNGSETQHSADILRINFKGSEIESTTQVITKRIPLDYNFTDAEDMAYDNGYIYVITE